MIKNTRTAPPVAGRRFDATVWNWKPILTALASWALLLGVHQHVIGADPLAGILP
ncbi:MAG: hypothetical protein ACFE0S_18140 [Rhodospirillales bacterium]